MIYLGRAPSIIVDAITKDVNELTPDELKIYIRGARAASSAGAFSIGMYGTDVLRGIDEFVKQLENVRK